MTNINPNQAQTILIPQKLWLAPIYPKDFSLSLCSLNHNSRES